MADARCCRRGVAATLIQSYERLQLALNPGQGLLCDINGQLSCSSVLTAWQSRAFGIPNSWIGLAAFAVFPVSWCGWRTGSRFARLCRVPRILRSLHAGLHPVVPLAVDFRHRALCLYCTIIGTCVVVINAVVWRIWNPWACSRSAPHHCQLETRSRAVVCVVGSCRDLNRDRAAVIREGCDGQRPGQTLLRASVPSGQVA